MSCAECVICSMPRVSPRVHTFVARNTRSCIAGVIRSPSTPSAVEYIGEVSMSRPPPSKNASSTSFSGARSARRAADFERTGRAEADDRNRFAARRNLARDQRPAIAALAAARSRCGHRHGQPSNDRVKPVHGEPTSIACAWLNSSDQRGVCPGHARAAVLHDARQAETIVAEPARRRKARCAAWRCRNSLSAPASLPRRWTRTSP